MGDQDGTDEERQCRFCFCGDEDGELIAPCLCKGDQKWIHVVRSTRSRTRRYSPMIDALSRCRAVPHRTTGVPSALAARRARDAAHASGILLARHATGHL